MLTNLLDFKKEIESKESYQPTAEESLYLQELRSLWQRDWLEHERPSKFFNDRNLREYMELSERDSFAYIPVKKKDSWRSRTKRPVARRKMEAVISAILDQNLAPEVFAHDIYGRDMREAADVHETLLRYSDSVENAEEKRKIRAFELLKFGTVANSVDWMKITKLEKKISKQFNPETGEAEWASKEVTDSELIWSKILPINRIILGDRTKYFISEQPHIWTEYVLNYSEAYHMFHKWKKWKFVKPISSFTDSWTETEMQADTETEDANYVRMRVLENRWTNEYALILNDVLMTPIGLPLPRKDGMYSIAWTQLGLFSNDFSYGPSFFHFIHNDGVILDFLYNSLIDKGRQGLEPPLVTSFKTILNKNMFAPGKVSHGDINLKPLVTHQGPTNADMAVTQFVEDNINKQTVAPIFEGQTQRGGQTAYEIREQQKSALRVLGLTLFAIAHMEADIAELKTSLIWEHYPNMKNRIISQKSKQVVEKSKTFVVHGLEDRKSAGRKEIEFMELPETKNAVFNMRSELREASLVEKTRGAAVKKYLVDPTVLRNFKYIFKVVANPAQRSSKLADTLEAREKYSLYRADPMIDPAWAVKQLLRANGDDEEEAMARAPQVPQGQPVGAGVGNQSPEGTGNFGATETSALNRERAAIV